MAGSLWARHVIGVGGPAQGAADRLAPAAVGGVVTLAWLEPAVELPGGGQFVGRGPDTGREPGKERGAEPGRLGDHGSLDGRLQLVGLDLHEQVVRRRTAVDPQRLRARAGPGAGPGGLGGHDVDDIAYLEGDRLERGPGQVGAGDAARQPEDRAP